MKLKSEIHFNVGRDGIPQARWVLRKCGVDDVADLRQDGILAGSGSLVLDDDDERLPEVVDHLRGIGAVPSVRRELLLSTEELNRLEWLDCRIATSGLEGGIGYGQDYAREGACPMCGAGAVPVPPLLANLPKMGRKHLDSTGHEGHLVVSKVLARAIVDAELTGFSLRPVEAKRTKRYDGHYAWLDITHELPRMGVCRNLKTESVCPQCERAGHYDVYDGITQYCYQELAGASDFNRTWEYFGDWHRRTLDPLNRVGGKRGLVVSQRVRSLFRSAGVKNVTYRPIWKGGGFEDVYAGDAGDP